MRYAMNPECEACGGKCCKYIRYPLDNIDTPDTAWLQARGVIVHDPKQMHYYMVSRCKFLDDADRCSIHSSRPISCRIYEVGGADCHRVQGVIDGQR